MFSIFSPLLGAKAPAEFPRLSENLAASQKLEVRKVLHGNVDGMFVVPRTQQMVAVAGPYLWKFSAQGELLDTLRKPSGMTTSGVVFTPQYYIDWVFTGDRQRKTYGPAMDGNALSQAELFAEFNKADVVEFATTDTTASAYLWKDGAARVMDLTRQIKQVDTYCPQRTYSADKLSWKATCFKDYKTRPKAWTEIEPQSFADRRTNPPRVEVVDFDRRKFHLEEGLGGQVFGLTLGPVLKAAGLPGSLPGRYWFGDAHTKLHVGNEVLKFKTFIPDDGGYSFSNMRWWEPAPVMAGAGPWFSVHMRGYMEASGEEALLKYYEDDIGLYVVRPKGTGIMPAAQVTTKNTTPEWRPVFEGPATYTWAVTGQVEFAATPPAHYWLRSPPSDKRLQAAIGPVADVGALWPTLRQLPTALLVQWTTSGDEVNPVLRVELQAAETQAAFERLRSANAQKNAPIELVVQVPDLKGAMEGMQVQLRSGSTFVPLAQTRFAYLVKPVVRVTNSTLREQLKAATAAAKASAASLPAFLKQAETLAQDDERTKALASNITAAYAELINTYNAIPDFKSSAKLVRHYIAEVHPLTSQLKGDESQTYNVGVIASQTLAFATHLPQDADLVDAVMKTLIGPDFDPQKQTNGTLMYNLSCYYAGVGDKPRMLQSVAAARHLGKPAAQFMQDTDFERYWRDAEFIDVLQRTP